MTKISGVVALLLIPVLVAGCSSSGQPSAAPTSPTTSSAAAPDPNFEKPEAGACRLEQVSDIPPSTNDTPTVPCSQRHTAITAAVVRLPAQLTFERNDVVDYVYKACGPASAKATGLDGATLAMSIVNYSWFIPSKAQQAAGARWVRCDVNAYTYDGDSPNRIFDLPAMPIKHQRLPEQLRLCFSGTRNFTRVSCSEPHTYRAESAARYRTHGKKYPGESARHAIGQSLCTAALHRTRPYSWAYPSESDWAADRAWFACLLPDEGTAV